jgi:hypothetical protein
MAEKMDELYSRQSIRDLEKRLFVARWGLRDAVKSDPDKVPNWIMRVTTLDRKLKAAHVANKSARAAA